jgi:hypothetical protein
MHPSINQEIARDRRRERLAQAASYRLKKHVRREVNR